MTLRSGFAQSDVPIAGSTLPLALADPALITLQDSWWLFPTSDGVPDWGARSFRAFSSLDLHDWTDHGEILRLGRDVTWATERAWAPMMVERNGRYYFYFTADKNIGVAVGRSPTGPFTDIGHPLVAHGDFEGQMIDPAVFIDDDGRAYLYWGNGTAYGVELNADMVSFDHSQVRAWQPLGYREAAWVHRSGDRYYLTWSENDTRSEDYRVRAATGESPLGPWFGSDVILQKRPDAGFRGTGHHSIARVPGSDEWVIAFHRFRIPAGHGYDREVMFAPLEHDDDGRIRAVEFPSAPFTRTLIRHDGGYEVYHTESEK